MNREEIQQLQFILVPPGQSNGPAADPIRAMLKAMGRIGARIGLFFQAMGWAEDEIKMAQLRHPEMAEILWEAFRFCSPGPYIEMKLTETLYRAHVRELLERIANGVTLYPATRAEVLVIISEASMAAPLSRDSSILMARLFRQLLPREAGRINDLPDQVEWESYPGRCDEIYAKLQHWFRREKDCRKLS